jgi:hypothetical protein
MGSSIKSNKNGYAMTESELILRCASIVARCLTLPSSRAFLGGVDTPALSQWKLAEDVRAEDSLV